MMVQRNNYMLNGLANLFKRIPTIRFFKKKQRTQLEQAVVDKTIEMFKQVESRYISTGILGLSNKYWSNFIDQIYATKKGFFWTRYQIKVMDEYFSITKDEWNKINNACLEKLEQEKIRATKNAIKRLETYIAR